MPIFSREIALFPDIDRAIEWAEDELVVSARAAPSEALPLDRLPLLDDFDAQQVERLRGWLEPVSWSAGDVIFRSGDPGSALYLVTKGRASIHIRHDGGDIRLITFAAGAVFGELALLDRGPRSATVTADEDLQGFGLSEASFAVLCREQPDIAIKAVAGAGARTERAHPLRQSDDPATGDVRHHGGSTGIKTPAARCRPPPS